MKPELATPETLVSIRTLLPRAIERGAEELTIGAAATLSAIERHAAIRSEFAALAEAASVAASTQLRNAATIGGNLLQRPRCWYFRNPLVHCWLKGGETCQARDGENQRHALFGESPCIAVHPSDPATALLGFDARVRLLGASGDRRVPLAEFFALPEAERRRETILGEDELVLDVALPAPAPRTRSVYLKAMDRGAFSFALVGVAVVVGHSRDGRIEHARIVLAGVAPIPWRSHAAERVLLGATPDETVYQRAAAAALEGAQPLERNRWKVPLARALVKRALGAIGRPEFPPSSASDAG